MNIAIAIGEIEAFVCQDYADRDIMHNLAHVARVRTLAKEIARGYKHDHLPESQKLYAEKEDYMRSFLNDLRKHL